MIIRELVYQEPSIQSLKPGPLLYRMDYQSVQSTSLWNNAVHTFKKKYLDFKMALYLQKNREDSS